MVGSRAVPICGPLPGSDYKALLPTDDLVAALPRHPIQSLAAIRWSAETAAVDRSAPTPVEPPSIPTRPHFTAPELPDPQGFHFPDAVGVRCAPGDLKNRSLAVAVFAALQSDVAAVPGHDPFHPSVPKPFAHHILTRRTPPWPLGQVRRSAIPVPPLEQHHRIVAQADGRMALCGQLEAQLTTVQTEASRLLESVLCHAPNGGERPTDCEFATAGPQSVEENSDAGRRNGCLIVYGIRAASRAAWEEACRESGRLA